MYYSKHLNNSNKGIIMATYECPKCQMSVNATCGKCNEPLVNDMLKESELIIAQEFCPSDYDWRIGIIDDKPFFACKYYMAKGHWQIYNWSAKKKNEQDGDADCLPIEKVPKVVLDMALKSARIMGKGLYGIDIKVVNNKPMVIEINDNPNVDFGVEDAFYGDLVYTEILSALKKRLE